MRIIVVGCGKIGTTILSQLVAEGHDVVAIDNNPEVVEQITTVYDSMGVCGNGADCDTLSEAGVEKANLVVAVTNSDELNMLSCFLARKMGARHTIARIRNPEYNGDSLEFIRQQLNLSMAINPELQTAKDIFNTLKLPSAAKIETFSRGGFEIVELRLKENSKLDGMRLTDLRKKYKASFLICFVQRGEQVYIPDGNFVLQSGDKIGLTASPVEIQKLLRMLELAQKQARNVTILGASTTAYYLAKLLIRSGNTVKIIEKDPARCEHFCQILPEAMVIQGDGASQELLLESGLRTTDAFVAMTGMDEENILISFYAASQNVPKTITKVNRFEFRAMAEKLGLDCIVSPRSIISDIVMRYARALQNTLENDVETLYQLMDGKAEALEFKILEDCPILHIPLKDLSLVPNTLIAGILRGRKTFIPSGNDSIHPGDKVIVIAVGRRINNLSDIIK